MNYQETLDFLTHALPAYHRVGAAAYKANLDNTWALMDYLGHPEQGLRAIHVAGTNGKGSVSHFLTSILHRAGLRVGLYTSPHLVDFRERIRVDGQKIPQADVVDFVAQHKDFFQQQGLSFFEMTVGMAFDFFRKQQVDIAVVEVGMGGRLDSTNVLMPELSIITNIGFDHTQFLGDTLAKIAGEKAGIIKAGIPVVVGETHPETAPVFTAKATEMHSPITFADQHYRVEESADDAVEMLARVFRDNELRLDAVRSPMDGLYQRKNIATLIAAIDEINALNLKFTKRDNGAEWQLHVDDDTLRAGIAHVIADTGLHGRWELLEEHPRVICETAHNADGVEQLVRKLALMHYRRLHIVYGCVNDKDYGHILDMLPQQAYYYYSQPSVERGLDYKVLVSTAKEHNRVGEGYADVHAALAAAKAAAQDNDLIVVTGSIFLVADLLAAYDIN